MYEKNFFSFINILIIDHYYQCQDNTMMISSTIINYYNDYYDDDDVNFNYCKLTPPMIDAGGG